MDSAVIRDALERLTANASRELLVKQPHGATLQLNRIISMQDESGLWHTVIDRDDSYLESSSAAGFALALGRALRRRLPGLDAARARDAYSRALGAICSRIDARCAFNDVSQQTPPGDFAFYNSIEIGTAPFATGVCMMALSEAVET